ncbi:TetR/AcrR family transcriptional regulator [Acrocarpospora catenulata]|uniref:TetR/AcrR family transcriptional regulator n=1 Tax=Acrocarpospora catenulata TaxID=2836182 RepID=UPI001BDA6720|nr:TetR/AcrR family transcriptional regulator [Acrocarpospora catenulata]
MTKEAKEAKETPPRSARAAVTDFKRGLLREAAKEVFSKKGIRDTSVREIAKAAGYATSAIYTHYGSVEELYGDIVRESLEILLGEIRAQLADETGEGQRVSRCVRTLYRYYITRPRDFELSFHLYDGIRPHGLNTELNTELNAVMTSVFQAIGEAFVADGLATEQDALARSTEASTYAFGLLLMFHTRRLFLLDQDADSLLDHYLNQVQSQPRRE